MKSLGMPKTVGVKGIAVELLRYYVPVDEFAEGRGLNVDKLRKGLGIEGVSVPAENQTTVTLAAECVRKLKEELDVLDEGKVKSITFVTEEARWGQNRAWELIGRTRRDGIDLRKAASTTTMATCSPFPIELTKAFGRCELAKRRGKEHDALIIASDISRYPRGVGEETGGGGATAWLLGIGDEDELIATLDKPNVGYTNFVPDWFRDNQGLPIFDGQLSLLSYNLAIHRAVERFKEEHDIPSLLNFVGNGVLALHRSGTHYTPKCAFALLYGIERTEDSELASILDSSEREVENFCDEILEAFERDDEDKIEAWQRIVSKNQRRIADLWNELRTHLKRVRKDPGFQREYDSKLRPSLEGLEREGNPYSASTPICAANAMCNKDLRNERIVMVSYGSGASANAMSIMVGKDYRDKITDVREEVRKKQAISFDEYLRIRKERWGLD